MDIVRDLICTTVEPGRRNIRFTMSADGAIDQDILFGNYVLRPDEVIEQGREYEVIIRPKGRSGNGPAE